MRADWLTFHKGNINRAHASCNDKLSQPGRLTDFWTFSADSGWTQVQDFPGAPRSNAAAFNIGNFGYVGTGYDGYNVFNDFWRYDPVQNVNDY